MHCFSPRPVQGGRPKRLAWFLACEKKSVPTKRSGVAMESPRSQRSRRYAAVDGDPNGGAGHEERTQDNREIQREVDNREEAR